MATLERAESKTMYSWWWLSHISPKNSIWLQENLKDMDAKVQQMIRLIKEDAESSSSRGEMYYDKWHVLMELVEEFFRAYRALAGRYDHATGVIRQAHRIMAEAVPNQVPLLFIDKSLASSCGMADDLTLSASLPLFEPNDEVLQDVSDIASSHFHDSKRNGGFAKESCPPTNKKGLKQVNDLLISDERVRHAKLPEGRAERSMSCHGAQTGHESGQQNELEACSLYESRKAGKNEGEVLALKESLTKSEVEREADLVRYQQSLERLSNLEYDVSQAQENSRRLNERANKAENEIEMIKKALTKLGKSKEASLAQHKQGLDRISNSESCNYLAPKTTEEFYGSASKAESDWESLRKEPTKVEAEKETTKINYRRCLEKQRELDGDWTCLQEQHPGFVEAGRTVQTIQYSHSKSQEERQSIATEFKEWSHVQQEIEINSRPDLEQDILKVKEEKKSPRELNISSTVTMGNLQEKILSSKERISNLEAEVELQVEQRNALHTEMSCLKEELNASNKRNSNILEQIKSVGLSTDCFNLSVKELQEENTKLKETEILERVSEKNQCRDSSLFDAKTELEILRVNFNDLEDSYLFLDNEKSSLETDRENLANMLSITQKALDDLERRHMLMNEKYEERIKLLLQKLKELQISLNAEKENLRRFINTIIGKMEPHYDGVKMIREDHEKEILISTEECDRQRKENESLPEANKELEPELARLLEEIDETKISLKRVWYELQKGEDAVQLWETQAEIAFADLQSCAIRETLFLEKIRELAEVFLNLEATNYARVTEIDLLKGKIGDLEDENGEKNAQLAGYIPVVASLMDSVEYLESDTLHYRRIKVAEDDSDKIKVSTWETHCHPDNCQQINHIQSDLLTIEHRIRAIDKVVLEMEKLSLREVSNASEKLEVVMKQIEELKSESERIRGEQSGKLEGGFSNEVQLQEPVPEDYDNEDEVMAKDIVLDQISVCSSYRRSWRENLESVELSDNSNNGNNSTVLGIQRDNVHSHQNEAFWKHETNYSSEITVEKELGVDRLVLSNRFIEHNEEETKRKILEGLDLDAKKLTNLAMEVRDLEVKAHITWESRGKCFDYDRVKGQLQEADDAIKKLFDNNSKLTKNIRNDYFLIKEKSATECDECASIEEIFSRDARVASEKIAQLQCEVQKLQSHLLRFNKDKERRGETKITRMIKRVGQKRNKTLFFNCLHPGTRGK